MKNILIIEDDEDKYENLKNYLNLNYKNIKITWKASYNSGLREILKKTNDLIILDMSLPIYDISVDELNSGTIPFAGIDILKQNKRFLIDIPVVVITQFETFGTALEKVTLKELKNKLEELKNDCYKKLIYYSSSSNSWELELDKICKELEIK